MGEGVIMANTKIKINDADEAYEIILDAIVTQQLAPSQKVSENILSDQFGISRTIARNLIEQLIAKQFLVTVSARVTQVAPLTLMEIKQNFALRKMMLPNIMALSAGPTINYEELYTIANEIHSMQPNEDDHSALAVLKLNRKANLILCGDVGYPLMLEWAAQLEDMAMRIYWLYLKTKKSFPYTHENQISMFEVMKSNDPLKVHKAVHDAISQTEEKILNAIFSHEQFYTQNLKV